MTNDSNNMQECVQSTGELNEFCEEKLYRFNNNY